MLLCFKQAGTSGFNLDRKGESRIICSGQNRFSDYGGSGFAWSNLLGVNQAF
jgi:hypothetical protein